MESAAPPLRRQNDPRFGVRGRECEKWPTASIDPQTQKLRLKRNLFPGFPFMLGERSETTRRDGRPPMKTRSTSLLATILILTVLACSRGDDDSRTFAEGAARGEDRREEAVPVEVFALERGTIESALRFSATLEAERDVQVFAEAQRRVVELRVEEGDCGPRRCAARPAPGRRPAERAQQGRDRAPSGDPRVRSAEEPL